jgi:hypothetical protein
MKYVAALAGILTLAWLLPLGPLSGGTQVAMAASSCGIPDIAVGQTDVAPGAFNPADTSLSRCVSTTARELNAYSSGAGVYNVKHFGARCNGEADDTSAIQRAERAAADAGHGTVYIPPGRCVISTGIAWDSNVNLVGSGMFRSTLAASSDFDYDSRNVRKGPDGRYVGMLWLDGPSETAPLSHVRVSDLGFDPRAGTQAIWENRNRGQFKYEAVSSYMRALQHVTFENLYFNLGFNSSNYIGVNDGPKGFTAFTLKVATDCNNPSYDISFDNIVGHNGDGTIQLSASDPPTRRCTNVTKLSNVRIDGVADFVDGRYIDDDRIVVGGSGVATSETSDVTISNVQTFVFDGVTGGVNAIKIQPGNTGTIHGVKIENVRYRGSGSGQYGSPIPAYDADGSGAPLAVMGNARNGAVNDVTVSNITATNSMGLGLAIKANALSGGIARLTVDRVSMHNCYATGAAFLPAFFSDPTGQDQVRISNVTIQAAPIALTRGHPIGFMIRGYRGMNGAIGTFVVSGVSVSGYQTPVYVAPGPSFSNLVMEHVTWDSGRVRLPPSVRFSP